jgi:hypothetical protein
MVETSKRQEWNRQQKGLDIVGNENILHISESVFVVKGSKNKVYRVFHYKPIKVGNKMTDEKWSCECWDFKARGRKTGIDCKHITASKVFLTLHGKW